MAVFGCVCPFFIFERSCNRKVAVVKIVGEKEGVSLAAFSYTQWGNTHKVEAENSFSLLSCESEKNSSTKK